MIFVREAFARSPDVTFHRVHAGQRGVSISRWFLCMQIGAGPDRLLEDAFTHRGNPGRDVDVCTRSRSPSAADPVRIRRGRAGDTAGDTAGTVAVDPGRAREGFRWRPRRCPRPRSRWRPPPGAPAVRGSAVDPAVGRTRSTAGRTPSRGPALDAPPARPRGPAPAPLRGPVPIHSGAAPDSLRPRPGHPPRVPPWAPSPPSLRGAAEQDSGRVAGEGSPPSLRGPAPDSPREGPEPGPAATR